MFSNPYTNFGVAFAAVISVIVVYVPGIKTLTMTEDPLSIWIFIGTMINLVLIFSWTEWRKWYSRNYPDTELNKLLAW